MQRTLVGVCRAFASALHVLYSHRGPVSALALMPSSRTDTHFIGRVTCLCSVPDNTKLTCIDFTALEVPTLALLAPLLQHHMEHRCTRHAARDSCSGRWPGTTGTNMTITDQQLPFNVHITVCALLVRYSASWQRDCTRPLRRCCSSERVVQNVVG